MTRKTSADYMKEGDIKSALLIRARAVLLTLHYDTPITLKDPVRGRVIERLRQDITKELGDRTITVDGVIWPEQRSTRPQ